MKKNSFGIMAIGTKINFENVYPFEKLDYGLRIITFQTTLQNGSSTSISVEISEDPHELLPNDQD